MRAVSMIITTTFVMLVACSETTPPSGVMLPALPVLAPAPAVSAAPAQVVARAAALAQEQQGYRFTFQMSLRGLPEAPDAPTLSVSGAGAIDQRADRSAIALDLRGLRGLLLPDGDADAAELDAFLGDGQIEMIQDATTLYVRMPFLARQLGATTPWISATMPPGADFEGLGGLGALGGLGGLGSSGSPADYLAQLKTLDATVRASGTEAVRGTETTRYSGMLDARSLIGAQLTPEEAAQLNAAMPLLDAFRIPYDVWIGADGLPRRIATTLEVGAAGPAGTPDAAPGMVFGYELFDYGAPGEIAIPPASQVTVVDPATLSSLR